MFRRVSTDSIFAYNFGLKNLQLISITDIYVIK